MEEGTIRFAKRKLRVQRCKTLPSNSSAKTTSSSTKSTTTSTRAKSGNDPVIHRANPKSSPSVPVVIPKGNPLLGEKLAGLSKEQRKQAKATDAERVARRLAKKKARGALAKAGLPEKAKKDRERVRKTPLERKGAPKVQQKKGRVRSEKSILKRNAKK